MLKKSVGRRSGPRRKESGTRERSGATIVRNWGTYRADVRKMKLYSVLKTGTSPVRNCVKRDR